MLLGSREKVVCGVASDRVVFICRCSMFNFFSSSHNFTPSGRRWMLKEILAIDLKLRKFKAPAEDQERRLEDCARESFQWITVSK